MKRLLLTSLLLHCLAIGTALADDDDDKLPAEKIARHGVVLSTKAQQLAGITTLTLAATQQHDEFTAYGKALSLQPLLTLQQRYVSALNDYNRAYAQFKQTEQTLARQNALYQSGVSAKRNLQSHQAQWQTDKAQRDTAQFQLTALRSEAQLTWGEALSVWLLSSDTSKFNDFLLGKRTLLQITLPTGKQLHNKQSVVVNASANRSMAHPVDFISPAPQIDNNAQGLAYFLASNDTSIKAGMSITAWLTEQNTAHTGVIVPKSALLWSMELAFVYVKSDATHFSRRVITHYTTTSDGYFVNAELTAGEQIVIVGGQVLLSEELRGQIPDDD